MKHIFKLLVIVFMTHISFGQNLYFPPVTGDDWATTSPDTMNYCSDNIKKLYDFLDENNTKAFLLLKDGKIVLEKYFDDHTANSLWYWASAGKTLTAFMVGLAQQEGFLNINDKTSDYLGKGWTNCNATQEDKISIRHQLTMTTGLDDGVEDPFCTLKNCLAYKAEAGSRWAYHNAPYTLLDQVIVKATGSNLNTYIIQKLKNKTGITGAFIPSGYNNVFFSTARNMARFGLLILNKGNWNGLRIMTDTTYFHNMTHRSQELNEAYGYLWWLNGSSSFMVPQSQFRFPGSMCPDAPENMIAAMGKNGQFLNVVPGQNLIWVRMGDATDDSDVSFLLNNKIWKYINELTCSASSIDRISDTYLTIFPNPAMDHIKIISDLSIKKIKIIRVSTGFQKTITSDFNDIDVTDLSPGLYFIEIMNDDGSVKYHRIIINP
ncbi:MAG: serine hydrolase [Deltaproteobacteria bacterium]